jgi:uncharacterized protein (TIGR00252 family)
MAVEYLCSLGYTLLSRNVHTPHGEIDLIAQATDSASGPIVFVEVKTRRTALFGPPEEAVNKRKQAHLLAAIAYYMQQNPHPGMEWRVDVIAIEVTKDSSSPHLTHFENALIG